MYAGVSRKGDVPALHDRTFGRIVDAVRLAVVAVSAQFPLEGPVFQLLGVSLTVDECSGSDGAQAREVRLQIVHFGVWGGPFQSGMGGPVG